MLRGPMTYRVKNCGCWEMVGPRNMPAFFTHECDKHVFPVEAEPPEAPEVPEGEILVAEGVAAILEDEPDEAEALVEELNELTSPNEPAVEGDDADEDVAVADAETETEPKSLLDLEM